MARGNQRDRDRLKAQAKEAKKGGKSKEGCPRARQERDAQAMREKQARKAAEKEAKEAADAAGGAGAKK
ncbi:unnamed protein product [Ectocarpus sp. 12 AP-2014]